MVVTLTLAGLAGAAGYGLTAPKRYRSTAQLLVIPVPANDSTYTGLDLLRSGGGKRTAAASAAALLHSPQVADAVRTQLGLTRSRDSLLAVVDPHVVGDSDVVAITVEDTSATGAAQLANAFADALVSQRTASFASQLAATIRRDEALLGRAKGAATAELQRRLAVLRGFEGQPDPTLRSAGQASAPETASWPHLPRLIVGGAGVGLLAGLVVALLLALSRLGRRHVAGAREPSRPEYGQEVPERVVERLEALLQEKVDALVTERRRIEAREAALAARERDVRSKLEELRERIAERPDEGEVSRREAALAAREQELREQLEARPAAPSDADEVLARREAELEAGLAELARREAELDDRVAALTRRELELARRAAATGLRERELEARAAEPESAAEPEPVPKPARQVDDVRPAPVAEEPPRPAVPPVEAAVAGNGGVGRWNLVSLELLVERRAAEFPDRREEWSSYLYFLREYAAADGSIPASFDWLIEDTFGELVT
jgi:hypothetical protein